MITSRKNQLQKILLQRAQAQDTTSFQDSKPDLLRDSLRKRRIASIEKEVQQEAKALHREKNSKLTTIQIQQAAQKVYFLQMLPLGNHETILAICNEIFAICKGFQLSDVLYRSASNNFDHAIQHGTPKDTAAKLIQSTIEDCSVLIERSPSFRTLSLRAVAYIHLGKNRMPEGDITFFQLARTDLMKIVTIDLAKGSRAAGNAPDIIFQHLLICDRALLERKWDAPENLDLLIFVATEEQNLADKNQASGNNVAAAHGYQEAILLWNEAEERSRQHEFKPGSDIGLILFNRAHCHLQLNMSELALQDLYFAEWFLSHQIARIQNPSNLVHKPAEELEALQKTHKQCIEARKSLQHPQNSQPEATKQKKKKKSQPAGKSFLTLTPEEKETKKAGDALAKKLSAEKHKLIEEKLRNEEFKKSLSKILTEKSAQFLRQTALIKQNRERQANAELIFDELITSVITPDLIKELCLESIAKAQAEEYADKILSAEKKSFADRKASALPVAQATETQQPSSPASTSSSSERSVSPMSQISDVSSDSSSTASPRLSPARNLTCPTDAADEKYPNLPDGIPPEFKRHFYAFRNAGCYPTLIDDFLQPVSRLKQRWLCVGGVLRDAELGHPLFAEFKNGNEVDIDVIISPRVFKPNEEAKTSNNKDRTVPAVSDPIKQTFHNAVVIPTSTPRGLYNRELNLYSIKEENFYRPHVFRQTQIRESVYLQTKPDGSLLFGENALRADMLSRDATFNGLFGIIHDKSMLLFAQPETIEALKSLEISVPNKLELLKLEAGVMQRPFDEKLWAGKSNEQIAYELDIIIFLRNILSLSHKDFRLSKGIQDTIPSALNMLREQLTNGNVVKQINTLLLNKIFRYTFDMAAQRFDLFNRYGINEILFPGLFEKIESKDLFVPLNDILRKENKLENIYGGFLVLQYFDAFKALNDDQYNNHAFLLNFAMKLATDNPLMKACFINLPKNEFLKIIRGAYLSVFSYFEHRSRHPQYARLFSPVANSTQSAAQSYQGPEFNI